MEYLIAIKFRDTSLCKRLLDMEQSPLKECVRSREGFWTARTERTWTDTHGTTWVHSKKNRMSTKHAQTCIARPDGRNMRYRHNRRADGRSWRGKEKRAGASDPLYKASNHSNGHNHSLSIKQLPGRLHVQQRHGHAALHWLADNSDDEPDASANRGE